MITVIGLLIGIVLGLTGSGGSILAVPLLLLLGLQPSDAMGLSLVAVCTSTLVGVVARIKTDQIVWRHGLILAFSGIVAAPIGRWLGNQINDILLLGAFTTLVLIIAIRMWRQANESNGEAKEVRARLRDQHREDPAKLISPPIQHVLRRLIPGGIIIGLLSGFFGVGGGFLIVPVLIFTGIKIERAVATSLLVISIVSAMGFVSHVIMTTSLPFSLILKVTSGSIAGILIATLIASRIAGASLQKLFAVLAVGLMVVNAGRALF